MENLRFLEASPSVLQKEASGEHTQSLNIRARVSIANQAKTPPITRGKERRNLLVCVKHERKNNNNNK